MAGIDPDMCEAGLGRKGYVPMDFTDRPMRGFVLINSEGLSSDREPASWLELSRAFNPRAKSSKDIKKPGWSRKNVGG